MGEESRAACHQSRKTGNVSRTSAGSTRLLVTSARNGERLDVFLAAVTDLSRRASRRLIADGLVARNGEVVRVQSRALETGDVIDIFHPEPDFDPDPSSACPTVEILHVDRWILVADKPPGVLSQPAERESPDDPPAFDEQVLLFLAHREGAKPFLRMVHRLDRQTSGAVLFARRPDALPKISRAWADHQVERYYIAVVEGHPDEVSFALDRAIARDPNHRWRFRCHERGKPARTEVEVLAALEEDLCLVGCRLVTGRTHQVRVHLADAGHPVLGDRLYGSNRAGQAGRPLLHAAALNFPHPKTGDTLRVICLPPPDFVPFIPERLSILDS
jgi:23S rRNA pseudouridine1911/1915/1917 synthase